MGHRNQTAMHPQPGRITLAYALVASQAAGACGEDEPLAVCTTWYARAQPMGLEQHLVAWHFPTHGRPVAMPVEKTGASPRQSYGVGRFIVLPHRALTLTLVGTSGQTHALARIELLPKGRPRRHVDGGPSDWTLVVTWSEDVEIDLCPRGHDYPACRVGELPLSEEQCSAFLRLGGMLRANLRSAGDIVRASLTCSPPESGAAGFVLRTETFPRGAVSVAEGCISHATYPRLREAAEHGRLDLGACWLLLPPRCQQCQSPMLGEDVCVETLWGPMHRSCVNTGRLQEGSQACSSFLPVAPEVSVSDPEQLAFQWAG